MHWVEMLPDTQTPSWLGLPSNAEKVLLTTQGMPQPHLSHLHSVTGPKKLHSSHLKAFMVTYVSSLTIFLHSSSSLNLTGINKSTERPLCPLEYCS